jgi:hypothetical protein
VLRILRAVRAPAAVVLTLAASFVVAIVPAPAADAHTAGDRAASNYLTTVVGLRPATPAAGTNGSAAGLKAVDLDAVDLDAVENGDRLRLTMHGDHTVLVGGYEDDLYLRIDSTGVYENVRSSAAYLNDDRRGTTVPPPGSADPDAEPRWERLAGPDGDAVTALWHDHRVHWMGTAEPAIVRADPGARHLIYEWAVPLTVDGRRLDAYGTLEWVPGPSPLPWIALAVALGVATAACGLARRRWGMLLATAAAGAVAAAVAHAALEAAADARDPFGAFVWGNAVSAPVWAVGLIAAALLLRRSVTGLYLAASAGAVIALVSGFGDVGVLYRSTAPAAGPAELTRALTAAAIGLGLGLVAATTLAARLRHRHDPERPVAADTAAGPAEPAISTAELT